MGAVDLSAKTIRDLLAELEWFSTLGAKRIRALAARAETLVWEPGETVFEEGDEGDRCYVIHTGQVKAIRSLADGRRVALAQIGAGNVFGELAMFGRKRRSTTIQAVEPTVAIGLESEDVLEALRSDAESSLRVASMLADRLEATNQRVIDQSLASVAGRGRRDTALAARGTARAAAASGATSSSSPVRATSPPSPGPRARRP